VWDRQERADELDRPEETEAECDGRGRCARRGPVCVTKPIEENVRPVCHAEC